MTLINSSPYRSVALSLQTMESKSIARYFIKIFCTAIAVSIAAWWLEGIKVDSIAWSLLVAFILGLLNTFIKPLLQLISIPFILISFGLFLVVINAVMLILASEIVPGDHFVVEGFWPAFWGSIIISIVSGILEPKDKDKPGNGTSVNVRIGRQGGE